MKRTKKNKIFCALRCWGLGLALLAGGGLLLLALFSAMAWSASLLTSNVDRQGYVVEAELLLLLSVYLGWALCKDETGEDGGKVVARAKGRKR